MISALKIWWSWQNIPLSGGSGKSLLKAIKQTPTQDLALILACVAHIRNKVYSDTGYDLYEDARRIREKQDAFMPAGKAIWMMSGESYAPFRRALTIWFYTVRVRKPDEVNWMCSIWREIQKASPLVEGVVSTVGIELKTPINYDGYGRTPKGVCQ